MTQNETGPSAEAQGDVRPRLGVLLERLEQIRRELDREDVDLEDQLLLYREGVGHVVEAKRILNEVRSEVEALMEETDAVPIRGAGVD